MQNTSDSDECALGAELSKPCQFVPKVRSWRQETSQGWIISALGAHQEAMGRANKEMQDLRTAVSLIKKVRGWRQETSHSQNVIIGGSKEHIRIGEGCTGGSQTQLHSSSIPEGSEKGSRKAPAAEMVIKDKNKHLEVQCGVIQMDACPSQEGRRKQECSRRSMCFISITPCWSREHKWKDW